MLLLNSYIIHKKDSIYSKNPISFNNYDSHSIYFVPDNTVIYSILIINIKTDFYFLFNYKIKLSPNKKIILIINL